MSALEEIRELDRTIAEHDLSEEHAERVRELVGEGVPVLDAIRQAGEPASEAKPDAPAGDDPAAGLEQPSEAMLKQLGKQIERHGERVRKIMGSFVEGFVVCTACDGLGLETPAPKAKAHPFYAACETCNGYGQVLTGSRDEENRGVKCPDCLGRGYLELLVDNTPAVELVQQWREERRRAATIATPLPPAVELVGPAGETRMGRPAWMGDPEIGASS